MKFWIVFYIIAGLVCAMKAFLLWSDGDSDYNIYMLLGTLFMAIAGNYFDIDRQRRKK